MIATTTGTRAGYRRQLKSILGELPITSQQAQKLAVREHTQLSPYLEAGCWRVSANVSDRRAAEDIEFLIGREVSRSVQQRLVHRQNFEFPQVKSAVEELSADGGNIRIRTVLGQPCEWKGYQAVCLHERQAVAAAFPENHLVIDWVNAQPIAPVLTCIGDGHDGIWNMISQLAPNSERREVLDWFHLMENLHKVGGSLPRLKQANNFLWTGKLAEALALLAECELKPAQNFCAYLNKHRHRRINYQSHQAEPICSIGSGAVESTVKPIDRRTKISGAQWKEENVPQLLAHRCAYLNGLISTG